MTTADTTPAPENHTFEADVAKLLHLMGHSVYSAKDDLLELGLLEVTREEGQSTYYDVPSEADQVELLVKLRDVLNLQ